MPKAQGRRKDQLVIDIEWRWGKVWLRALRGMYWWCDNVHGKATRLRLGVAVREPEEGQDKRCEHGVGIRIPDRGTLITSCGAPASQTHISTVACRGHGFYTKNTGQKGLGSRARVERDRIVASVSKLWNQRKWFHNFWNSG
jgi:hypothetical protein